MTLDRRQNRAIALSLAVAASLLELGPLVTLLQNEKAILDLLIAGLAYQLGNAAPRPVALSGRYVLAAATLTSATIFMAVPVGTLAWFLAISSLSWALQIIRRNLTLAATNELPTTAQKRVARVLGFVAAALVPLPAWTTGVLLATGVALVAMPPAKNIASHTCRGFGHPIEWTMLVHQVHYFSYAYAVPLLVATTVLGGLPLVGLWFACGWISYLSAEFLWRRWPPRRVFLVGHLFLAVVLMVMSMTADAPWITLVFWVLSGFGGGTVYCLALLHKGQELAHERLERAEDAGHLLGVLIAIAGVSFLNWNAISLPAVGSMWAIAAALGMIAWLIFDGRQRYSSVRPTKPTGGTNASQ